MLVSAVITTYNTEQYLTECLQSIYNQTYPNIEIIIVNDGGKPLSHNYDRVKIIQYQQNKGYGYALSLGISESNGNIITVIDSDDYLIGTNTITTCVNTHIKYPDISMTYSDYYDLYPDNVMSIAKGTKIPPDGKLFDNYTKGKSYRVSHLKTFKIDKYNKTEGIDPTLRKAIDRDLILKLEEVGELHYIPEFMYAHRIHNNSISNSFSRLDKKEQNRILKQKEEMYRKTMIRRNLI